MVTSTESSDPSNTGDHSTSRSPVVPESVRSNSGIMPYIERMWILFCLYTLSIGPMYWHWLSGREVRGSTLIAVFYEPLRILGVWFPLFGEWLNWYVRLWIL
ncbi:MAG TPA: hypothetical protein VNQ76_14990 [Planctomicrobium sp.]|nr:hypothetical protein [Planctomicrobium sp.]